MTDTELLKTPIWELIEKKLLLEGIAAKDRKIAAVRKENESFVPTYFGPINIISDNLGTQGVFNPADGKRYDSKSQYYQSLKDAGCVVMEAGMDKPRKQRGNYDCAKELKQAAQQIGYI